MTKIRGGLIQMGLKRSTELAPDQIREAMLDLHVPMIEKAGEAGVQVLSFQEVFTQPYFCPSQDSKWYAAAEAVPDGSDKCPRRPRPSSFESHRRLRD